MERQKDDVVSFFREKGTIHGGFLSFRDVGRTGNASFVYDFSYSALDDLFYAGVVATSSTNISTIVDYGEISFEWGNFKRGSFTGSSRFDVSNLSYEATFAFSNIRFESDLTIGDRFSYKVLTNTFNTDDVSEEAKYSFQCVQMAAEYAQSVLYASGLNVTLW